MKSDLWVVIVVTVTFVGFLIGYSLPPLVETGMLTGKGGEQAEVTRELGKDMEQYYRDLLKDEE
ncbi:MAG: hypothetical protein BMS9Abin25_0901 [Gammaproteobacteria bacterium]|nr:MAG: hypothetical protein BMS9Abin25_0901 [Gammaproteobacteria bacterium]